MCYAERRPQFIGKCVDCSDVAECSENEGVHGGFVRQLANGNEGKYWQCQPNVLIGLSPKVL